MIAMPDREAWIFSLKSFIGAMLALYLSFRLGLPRPFWAPLTAYVVAQPIAGAVRSKALYRVIGTFIGALATVIFIPTFINYSVLMYLVFGVWIGFCLYVSMLDRTPRAYAFMLSGYSVALIALPSLIDVSNLSISSIYDVALARVEEITLGITCSALVHSLVFPKGVGNIVLTRLDQALKDAQQWVRSVLTESTIDPDNPVDLNKLAQIITELRMMSTHLPFDTSNLRWTANIVRALQDRLSALVPILSTIEDRLGVLRNSNTGMLSREWQKLMDDIADWAAIGVENEPGNAIRLRKRIDNATPVISADSHWEDMLLANLAAELYRLVDICEDCFDLRRQINIGLSGAMPPAEPRKPKVSTTSLHVDRRLALSSAFAAMMATSLSCLFWVISGWPMGFCAPMMAGMYSMFFATMDNPVPILKVQLFYTLLSTPVAGLYLLLFLPSAHSFEMMMLVFAPFLLWFGTYLSKPATMIKVIPFMFTTLATLTMFDMGSANMTSFINSQVSQAIGAGMAVLFTALFRIANIEAITRRLVKTMWTDISRLGKAIRAPSVMEVSVRMVDGISLLAPRLALARKNGVASEPGYLSAMNILSDLRVGLNMTRLLRLMPKLQRQGIPVHPVLENLSAFYEDRMKDDSGKDVPVLLDKIDTTLYQLARSHHNVQQNDAIAALAGIRRDLFPDALPYSPLTASQKENGYGKAA